MSEKISLRFFTPYSLDAACMLLSINGKRVLIDPGASCQIKNNQRMLEEFQLSTVDYVAITHYHGDHANLVAQILQSPEFTGKIICHPATRDILCSYYDLDARAPQRFLTLQFGQKTHLFDDTHLMLFNAGHVLGSAMLYFEASGKRILFTGDMGAQFLPLVRPPDKKLPDAPLDLLVLDGKHADRLRDFDLREHSFGDIIYHKLADCFLYDDGNVLIFAPVIQTPLLIYCLNYIFHNPEYLEFQRKVNYVFLDPQSKVNELLEIFKKHHDLLDTTEREYIPYLRDQFYFDKLKFKHSPVYELHRSILITANRQQFVEWFKNLKGSAKNDVLLLYHNIASVLKEKIDLIDEACDIQIKRLPFLHLHPDQKDLKLWCQELGQRTQIKQTVFFHYNQTSAADKIKQNFRDSFCGSVKLVHQIENRTLEI
jgi:hypothetical protein